MINIYSRTRAYETISVVLVGISDPNFSRLFEKTSYGFPWSALLPTRRPFKHVSCTIEHVNPALF